MSSSKHSSNIATSTTSSGGPQPSRFEITLIYVLDKFGADDVEIGNYLQTQTEREPFNENEVKLFEEEFERGEVANKSMEFTWRALREIINDFRKPGHQYHEWFKIIDNRSQQDGLIMAIEVHFDRWFEKYYQGREKRYMTAWLCSRGDFSTLD